MKKKIDFQFSIFVFENGVHLKESRAGVSSYRGNNSVNNYFPRGGCIACIGLVVLEGREEVDPALVTFPFPPVLPVRLLHVKLVGSVGEEDQTRYGLKNLT